MARTQENEGARELQHASMQQVSVVITLNSLSGVVTQQIIQVINTCGLELAAAVTRGLAFNAGYAGAPPVVPLAAVP